MSDTVTVTVPNNDWVEVSNSALNGLITNEGTQRIRLFEDATKPTASDSVGHTMQPTGDYFRYSLTGSQKIWAKSMGEQPGEIAVTSE